MSDTNSETSKHSDISRYNVTPQERKTIRSLDGRRCFVTNTYSHRSEVAHILDNFHAGNRDLVYSLRGLGIVHPKFNLTDISNLILMSREMHYLWDKYAAFVIIPSQATRADMIEIVEKDRRRVKLARRNGHTIYPCQLAYPKAITYDILFLKPSLFGSPGLLFPRIDYQANITYYSILTSSPDQEEHLEYLTKLDDETQVREFQNIEHVTGRPESQAVNPYLMVINASDKLNHWEATLPFNEDPGFQAALQDCQTILKRIAMRTGANIHMNRGSSPLNHDPSTERGMQNWISHCSSDTMSSIENWRQEVKGIDTIVEAFNNKPE